MKVDVLLAKFCKRFFPGLMTSKLMTSFLRQRGVDIGEGTCFFDAGSITVDYSRPALISIGKYCKITGGVIILAHDYSRSVLRRAYGDVIGEARKTVIGDNVFVGMRSILLMGTQIGNNCIVGAGSVCHGSYPDNSVIAGNPARVICTLDEYYSKRKEKYVGEAMEYAALYKDKYGDYPSINAMGAFFPLYLERSKEALQKNGIRTNLSGDSQEDVIEKFLQSEPQYADYSAFLREVSEYEKEYHSNNIRIS